MIKNAILAVTAGYLYTLTSLGKGVKVGLWTTLWILSGGYNWLYLFSHTCKRDFRLLFRGVKLLIKMGFVKYGDQNVVNIFRQVVNKHPGKVMYINATDDSKWTYQDVEEYSNRVANYFLAQGYVKGDTVALLMNNRPEYVATWIGLAKAGIVPALINHNLRQTSLVYTITVAGSKAVIYGLELEDAVTEIYPELCSANLGKFAAFHSKSGSDLAPNAKSKFKEAIDLDQALAKSSSSPEPKAVRDAISVMDPLLYIYTSGTTGMPKPVIIKHIRQLFAMFASHCTIGLTNDDIIYCYLPLYHSSGGQVGTASSITSGTTTVIKKKFSASTFWTDCVKYNVTATQYIGEICRYLLATPKIKEEHNHKVRIMFGNGLRPQIWTQFTERFNIKNIAEFYGATEGNSNMVNIENKVGCVGFIGVCFPTFIQERLLPLYIIKVDKETGEPIRDANGFCIETDPGEPGEFIGKIVRGDPVKDFTGYKDPEATKKKILHNVFKQGDMYFRSGDILIKDKFGWLHFKDRSGDTFRWKGENVSTLEVEATVSNVMELKDATAYGVAIPNMEGRAGMIAIPAKDESEVDLVKLYNGVSQKLPAYARPFFVRLVKELHMTGTYKLKKNLLQEDGFDVTKIKDPVFFLDAKVGKYVPLTKGLHDDIVSGKLRM